jgi:cytochrome P450 family 12
MKLMYKTYGPISKITNIPGKRDLVFLYDPRDFETVFRNEGQWPLRPVMDSFPYYRNVTRKDIFQGVSGIVSV